MIAINQNTIQMLFALVRSAIRGNLLSEQERAIYSDGMLPDLMTISKKHDISHLVAEGLNKNGLLAKENSEVGNEIIKAIYRHAQLSYEYVVVCDALEATQIPFIPLKGSVLRGWYPEPWMRTSCDIDILVHREHLEQAISYLVKTLEYTEHERATHDVSLFSKNGKHIELHFDLVEEGRAGDAISILKDVWENVSLKEDKKFWYEMTDEYFYFYHIAHMAKHFETGGCGIRPFIDLWILDHIDDENISRRNALLEQGGLLKFADAARKLSKSWLDDESLDTVSHKLQNFILSGGVYGSTQNRVALQQTKKGGKIGYMLSRIFIPYDKLKRYYPVLEKHRWLTPFMQIRRWGMLFQPSVAKMAKSELSANKRIVKALSNDMNVFLNEIGL